jgi:hypothetical protein
VGTTDMHAVAMKEGYTGMVGNLQAWRNCFDIHEEPPTRGRPWHFTQEIDLPGMELLIVVGRGKDASITLRY